MPFLVLRHSICEQSTALFTNIAKIFMKRNYIYLPFLFFFASFSGFSQIDDSTMFRKHPPKPRFWDNVFIGGGLGAQFGSKTAINISPLIGYKFTEKITAGVGAIYQYFHYREIGYNLETNIFGGNVFGRYFFTKNLFGHAEIEYLNLEAFDYYPTRRVDVESFLAGGGYIQRFGQNSGIILMVLYNFTPSYYTPYNNPIIRIGLNIGL